MRCVVIATTIRALLDCFYAIIKIVHAATLSSFFFSFVKCFSSKSIADKTQLSTTMFLQFHCIDVLSSVRIEYNAFFEAIYPILIELGTSMQ